MLAAVAGTIEGRIGTSGIEVDGGIRFPSESLFPVVI